MGLKPVRHNLHVEFYKSLLLATFITNCGIIGVDFRRATVASAPGRITSHTVPPYEQLDLRHEFAHLFSGKWTKTAATRAALFDSSMHQIVCRLGLRPRPHWGAYSAPPDHLIIIYSFNTVDIRNL